MSGRFDSRKSDSQEKLTHSELLDGLWPLFLIGKCTGMLLINRNRRTGNVSYNPKSVMALISLIVGFSYWAVFIFAVMILVRNLKSPDTNVVEQMLDLIYHFHVSLMLTACCYQSKNFPELFHYWSILEEKLSGLETFKDFHSLKNNAKNWDDQVEAQGLNPTKSTRRTSQFFRFPGLIVEPIRSKFNCLRKNLDPRIHKTTFVLQCWALTGFYFSLALIGALAYFSGIAVRDNSISIRQYLEQVAEVYILKEYSTWYTGLYVLVLGHIMEISWAYGDMLIFFFSLTLRHQYLRFNKVLEKIRPVKPSVPEIEILRGIHWELAMGIKKADRSLGLITTTTFTCNILYLFSRVFLGIAEDLSSPKASIVFEAGFAFTYLIGRIFFSAIIASNLSQETKRTLNIIMEFPEDENIEETHFLMMDRFLSQVITGEVALTGNGYFVLNRNFIGSLISAIATYEIIIIQFSEAIEEIHATDDTPIA